MTIRAFGSNFEVVDQTPSLLKVPQTWSLIGSSGLFQEESLTTHVATMQEIGGSLVVVGDSMPGSKPMTVGNDLRKIHSYSLSHHQLVDALYPSDIQGKSAYNDLSVEDTEAAALVRKMEKIRKSFDVTLEIARFRTLNTGAIWAPNGTISGNFYTDFGYTKNEVDFVLGTATTDVIAKCEAVISDFQAKSQDGEVITSVTGYASPAFFAALIAHAKVQVSYTYQVQAQGANIQRERAGGMGLYRTFNFGGINFIEVPTILAGTTLITAKDCIFVANGTDAFVTMYGPARRFGYIGTRGEKSYMWTQRTQDLKEIKIEAEANFLNILRKPYLVSRGFTS
jgi:hypothetical protein